MNKKKYIKGNYPDLFTAAGKAKIDAEEIVNELGYRNCALPRTHYKDESLSVKIRFILSYLQTYLSLCGNNILFFQYPSTKAFKFLTLAKKRKCKIILLIHDLNCLRGASVPRELKCIEMADVVIVHTQAMRKWLEDKGIRKKYIVLEIFDYLKAQESPTPTDYSNIRVAFAGNIGKSVFIDQLEFNNIALDLFGVGAEHRVLNKGVTYKGCYPPEELAKHITAHYGLVWDGDSIETCDGDLGNYLRIIASHKLSMYLSAGIPVIVWEDSAMADYVRNNNVGIAVKSLKDLDRILPEIPSTTYNEMRHNVKKIAGKLKSGNYLKIAIAKAEQEIK